MTIVKRLFIAAAILVSTTAAAQLKKIDIAAGNYYEKTGETCFAGVSVEDKSGELYVSEVFPAVRSEFKAGDRVLAIGSRKIATRKEWEKFMEASKPGTKVQVQIERSGKPLTIEVELEKIDVFGRVI